MPELIAERCGEGTARPTLSLVTATYQRRAELEALLASLTRQVPDVADAIELVFCDNASGDGTLEILADYVSSRCGCAARVYRQSHNVGVDRNILDVITLARGTYVWFIADDDEIALGKLHSVCEFLRTNDVDMAIARSSDIAEWDRLPLAGADGPQWLDPGDPAWASVLFATSFLASVIFSRDRLEAYLPVTRSLVGTGYAAWGLTLSTLSHARRVAYFDGVCVLGNKNFNGQPRFATFEVMVKGRIDVWDRAASGRVRASLRPLMIRHALEAWRSVAAASMTVRSRRTLVADYAASLSVLGSTMLRGLPWVLTALTVPRPLRRRLDGLRVRIRSGGSV